VSAKHGLEGLSKVIALEGAQKGLTSNCVNAGYVNTPLVQRQLDDQSQAHGMPLDEVMTNVLLTRPAIKRLIEPGDVASLVRWLCGPDASMVTGRRTQSMVGGWPHNTQISVDWLTT
jgi:3-hydroxybutyrate dehydrogenase